MTRIGTCAGVVALLWAASTTTASAQTFKTLVSFDGTNGLYPDASLVQGTDGNFYGTTYEGNPVNDGTIFRITPQGALTTIHSFGGTDGSGPVAGLVQGTDGSFYGTTIGGGTNGRGNVFKITPAGKLTLLHSFCTTQSNCPDGADPYAGLVQGTDGNLLRDCLLRRGLQLPGRLWHDLQD